ncbi:hypothetical protein OWR29_27310 [Actinoplanes sp. Pm04-4]|uniref:Uncharacterized protein n=1 Tax=Paractinoplanes pyxinae TaxID=2997416 RepID=A0ABT4B5E8_9ACTN|nr:hypothetical protein [Actinoplanes pyxinae]MCY1141722.1 hypothetical protein [Actinoplanes pyxinae]
MSRPRGPEPAGHRPLYARMLRLKFLRPSGFLCFVFLEGSVALGILLALAELVSWWGVLVLPVTVAIMVKLNDVIAGSLTPPPVTVTPSAGLGAAARSAGATMLAEHAHARTAPLRPAGMTHESRAGEETTRLPGVIDRGRGAPIKRPWVERAEAQQQWIRQSATRRYE